MLLRSELQAWPFRRCSDCISFTESGRESVNGDNVHGIRTNRTERTASPMTLQELVNIIGNKFEVYIDGNECGAVLSDDTLSLKIESINIKTNRTQDDLGSLGYSFEVGV